MSGERCADVSRKCGLRQNEDHSPFFGLTKASSADNNAHSGCLAGIGEVVTGGGFAASATGSAGFTGAGSAVAAGLGASAAGPDGDALSAAAVLVFDCPAPDARGLFIFPFDF